ncbi:cell wall glycosyl hydrolase [Grosmannia clavigera kw1407]|uniref:Mannan endo-1,6-alpha-mannosidase n=1 Tax=Grosmannia clavigera (strain kw1407 / UAMH 11150) TaxID=655863 RepID=F0XIM4_GROCL|nr:cell wall glycosyl hydrolase [Grosmannia clavigera kw1407]EFX02561.1 cell wall glycosyl hydrolase [Grosmannia clavigera kw1407]
MKLSIQTAGIAWLLAQGANAIVINATDSTSVKAAASTVAYGLLKYYTGNNTGDVAGNLPDPYFWWEAGAMFGTLVDYWFMTGDDTYNNETLQALVHQAGNNNDFMPANQTSTEGNDDQGFWAMAAMSAAENNFPNPADGEPQWLALAQAVFNEYTTRWDTASCNGGMRWQIFTFNNGYNYKNSISNGCFFNLATRLWRFTGNQTYADWATKVWDWETGVGFITSDYKVYDGASVSGTDNCSTKDTIQWSYNAGIFLHGAAVMYNGTNGTELWKTRVDGLWNETRDTFFNNSIMVEQACETVNLCDNDEQSFKGYLARWMAGTAQMAPYTSTEIVPLLQANAAAAAAACSGSPATGFKGLAGTACGFKWYTGSFDGTVGVGEQMNALSAIMYSLVQEEVAAPVTASTGGTSKGNPSAGTQTSPAATDVLAPITTASRVAAGFLTTAVAFSLLGGGVFLVK